MHAYRWGSRVAVLERRGNGHSEGQHTVCGVQRAAWGAGWGRRTGRSHGGGEGGLLTLIIGWRRRVNIYAPRARGLDRGGLRSKSVQAHLCRQGRAQSKLSLSQFGGAACARPPK